MKSPRVPHDPSSPRKLVLDLIGDGNPGQKWLLPTLICPFNSPPLALSRNHPLSLLPKRGGRGVSSDIAVKPEP